MEVWKDIHGYNGLYQISSNGRIRSYYFGKCKYLKLLKSTNGYLRINLFKDKISKGYLIHQLLFYTFKNIKSNRILVVDHIDNNIFNNKLDNLQLVTNRYNSSKDKKQISNHYNIYNNGNSFLVRMRINQNKYSIGTYKNIQQAINSRDYFINNILININNKDNPEEIKEMIQKFKELTK